MKNAAVTRPRWSPGRGASPGGIPGSSRAQAELSSAAATCPSPLRQMIHFMGCHKSARKLSQIRQKVPFPRHHPPFSQQQGATWSPLAAILAKAAPRGRRNHRQLPGLPGHHKTLQTNFGFPQADPSPAVTLCLPNCSSWYSRLQLHAAG